MTIPLHRNGLFGELKRELDGIPKRMRATGADRTVRAEILERYRTLGVRYSSFKRWERQQTGARRKDAGTLRKEPVWRPIIEEIFAIQCQMSDFEGGRMIAADLVLREAGRRGIIRNAETLKDRNAESKDEGWGMKDEPSAPTLSVRNYNHWVQKLGLRKPRGFTRFAAQASNEVHQMDVTGSPYLEVVEHLGEGEFLLRRRPPRQRLSKIQKDHGYRLWLIGIVDDFSGVAAARYVVARGEGAAWMRCELHKIWSGLDPQLPLRGLPDTLYCDNGPFARTAETEPFLSAELGLGVELKLHEPYRSRSTGKIERLWRTIKNRFETGFLSGKDAFLLSEVNAMLVRFLIEQSRAAHRTLPLSRERAYFSRLPQTVRLPQEQAERNAFRVYERTVDGNGVFRLDNVFYQVSAELRSQRVLVYRNAAGEVAVECPVTGVRETAQMWDGPTAFGDFQSFPETTYEHTAKSREVGDWGEADHPFATPLLSPRTQGDTTHVVLIPEEAEPTKDSPFTAAAVFGSELEARTFIAREVMPILRMKQYYPQMAAAMDALLGHTLTREEISAWAAEQRAQLENGQAQAGGGL